MMVCKIEMNCPLCSDTCEYYVEVEPVVRGHWIKHFDDIWPEDSTMECSACHEEEYMTLNNTKRCPNCGAYMDLDKTSDLYSRFIRGDLI